MPADTWHLTPQAKAIIGRLHPAELLEQRRPCIPVDEYFYVGLTDRAHRHLTRLEALRREAIDTAAGMTWAEADRADDTRKAWLRASYEVTEVADVLREAFAEREARRSVAA